MLALGYFRSQTICQQVEAMRRRRATPVDDNHLRAKPDEEPNNVTKSWSYASPGGARVTAELGLRPHVRQRATPLAGRQDVVPPHDQDIVAVGVGPVRVAAPETCDSRQPSTPSAPANVISAAPIPTPKRVTSVFAKLADVVESGVACESRPAGTVADLARARTEGHDVCRPPDPTRPLIPDS
jgi:hypothetical protein